MTDESYSLLQLVKQDPRYPIEAYKFINDAISYAADSMELGNCSETEYDDEIESEQHRSCRERHLTGQELCESIREYALNQFGYMSQIVLNRWGIFQTSDFGELVYNMIDAGIMKKSSQDQKSHFDDNYEFEEVFQAQFDMCSPTSPRRS